jgi:thiol-disulfide isomerase/thioredoxin
MTPSNILCTLACLLAVSLQSQRALGETPRPFVQGSWQALRQAYKGEPVVVHFWGLTCGPCLAELPQWGAFAARHAGLQIILVNWDRRAEDQARIEATLAKAGLGSVKSWVLADSFEEKMRFKIDRDWMGELPRTLLIARDGNVTAFSGAADFSALAAWLAAERAQ